MKDYALEVCDAIIGGNAGQPIRTPYPNCGLVMPSSRQLRPGVTVARLGRLLP